MSEEHFWAALVYVEQNPLRAGLADDCTGWRWSSTRAHLAGIDGGLLDLVRWREQHTPGSWKRCLELGLQDAALLERIREGTLARQADRRRRVPRPHWNPRFESRPVGGGPATPAGQESPLFQRVRAPPLPARATG